MQVAPVGGDASLVLVGVRELPAPRLELLHVPEDDKAVESIRYALQPLGVDAVARVLKDGSPVTLIEAVTEIVHRERARGVDVYVNVSSGSSAANAAATAGALLNGARAFVVERGETSVLPFPAPVSVGHISRPKAALLRALRDGGEATSLRQLGDATRLGKSVVSHHLRGKGGLEESGLVRVVRRARGRLAVDLTPAGRVVAASVDAPR